ncbi:hypothetical protein LLG88_13720 [bacterium]|nr:hypothetical protein [bacterium]
MALTKTTIAGAIGATDGAASVTTAGTVAVGMLARIDDEAVKVTKVSGTRVELARGQQGKMAVAHDVLAPFVYGTVDDWKDINFGPSAVAPRQYSYGQDGAVTPKPGTHIIRKATAAGLTLANPSVGENGTQLHIVSATAAAHTITTDGFNTESTSSDVATFGAAIGNFVDLEAIDGRWVVLGSKNVTLG